MTSAASARGGRARAMIDAPKLRACPLSEIKLANRAGGRSVRTLLAAATAGCVIRRTPTRCPIFFHAPSFTLSHPPAASSPYFRNESFRILAIGEREATAERARGADGVSERRRRRPRPEGVDFRNYETPLAPGDPSVGGGARGAARPRQCHFNYAC